MSRLKGADLGVTNPTLASLGAAKITAGAGLPPFSGRNAGDGHYDTAAKTFYTLTGSPGSGGSISDTYTSTDIASVVGRVTETGGATWAALTNGLTGSPGIVSNRLSFDSAANRGVYVPLGTAGTHDVSADLTLASGGRISVHVRISGTDSGTGYKLEVDRSAGTIRLMRGSGAALVAGLGTPAAGPENYRLTATGTSTITLTAYRNNVQIGTYVDSTPGTVGNNVGVSGIGGSAGQFSQADNFGAVDIGTLAWTAISVPNALNNRGPWSASPSPAYAVNDLVTRNNVPYVAIAGNNGIDPLAAGGSFVGTATGLNSTTAFGANSVYESFTVNTVTTVAALQVGFATASTGHFTVGIASAVGASPSAVTWLTNAAAPTVAAGGNVTVPVPAVVLQPGVTYYFVAVTTDGGNPGANQIASSSSGGSINGVLASLGGVGYASGVTTIAWTAPLAGYALQWGIGNNNAGLSYWQPLSATAPLNYRGAWTASPSPAYAANDVVTDAGALWSAMAVPPAGAPSEPVLGLAYVPSPVDVGHATVAGAVSTSGWKSFEMAFTTGASAQVVTAVQLSWLLAATGTFRIGIATAPGANDTAVSWLGTTPSVQSAPSTAGVVTYALPSALSLSASTTYYVVLQALTGSPSDGLSGSAGTVTTTGCIASVGALQISNTIGGAWAANTWHTPFTLVNGAPVPYWQPLASTVENVNVVAASGAAVTLPDVTVATMHRVTLTAATPAITLPAPGAGKSFTVELVQDATGGRAPTWVTPTGAIRWPGGTPPTITATANAIDVITFICIGGVNWYGFVAGQAFA